MMDQQKCDIAASYIATLFDDQKNQRSQITFLCTPYFGVKNNLSSDQEQSNLQISPRRNSSVDPKGNQSGDTAVQNIQTFEDFRSIFELGPLHYRPVFDVPLSERRLLIPNELKIFAAFWRQCITLCWCSFTLDGSLDKVFKTCADVGPHTDYKILRMIEEMENLHDRKVRKVVLISSVSPCRKCSEDIIEFVRSRGCVFDYWFTKIYKHDVEEHYKGLQMLSKEVRLGISNYDVWKYLIQITDFQGITPSVNFMMPNTASLSAWYLIWHQQLKAIIREDYRSISPRYELEWQWMCSVNSNSSLEFFLR